MSEYRKAAWYPGKPGYPRCEGTTKAGKRCGALGTKPHDGAIFCTKHWPGTPSVEAMPRPRYDGAMLGLSLELLAREVHGLWVAVENFRAVK